MSSSPSRQQGSVDPQKITPYSRNFQQHLIQHGVYPCGYKHRDGSVPAKPDNWKEIKQILVQRRPSLSPSKFTDEEYERFFQDDVDASKEKDVSVSVIPMIEGNIADKKCHSGGIPFGNLNPLINSAVKLTSANPDVYYGASLEQLSQKAVDELGGRIIPSTQHDLPILPNFFLEVKGPDGSLAVAGRQACYVGALGARAVHSLQSYGQEEPVYDNNAYTITSIYHGGALKMYTSHVTQPRSSGGRPRYHMNHLASFSLAGDRDTCVAGLQAYRNGRQWAEKQRNEAIRQANERANIVEDEVPDGDAVATRPAIFTTAVSETKTYNMRQESRTPLDDDYSTLEGSEDSDSPDELAPLPVKRAKRYSKNQQIKQNQRNANVSSEAGRRDGSAVVLVSQGYASNNVTSQQNERWSWTNGIFQCHKGKTLMKEQDETPADVWIYCDEGWPNHGGKKWRLWIPATREILYC